METLAVTGYKPHECGIFTEKHPGVAIIKEALKRRMIGFIEEGVQWFITSGALGVEIWASETVIELKQDYPNIRLAILTPYLNQELRWKAPLQEKYHAVIAAADYVASITKRPYESPAQLRLKNDFIVRKTDALLMVYDDEQPGSPIYYLEAAKNKQKHNDYPIFYINQYDLEDVGFDLRDQIAPNEFES
ncbi:DUF1273 domain-containing protein [Camelliibacillus cellulosilyticus]|uniref:UPF0398 protein ACFO4N_03110 n=1 Tax=Camelliibacillus cellulosilyticus TaxID=2174486 RepID=A0ABV9GKK9_9BACL